MMQFLSPAWFLSLLALAIPIAIHLLSRKSGKRIKVGSVRFLESSQSAQLKSVRLNELILLLIRAALLTLLCALLARPVWRNDGGDTNKETRGQVFVAPELLVKEVNRNLFDELDSLASAGHELRLLASGFPPIDIENPPANFKADENWWSLLNEIDASPSFFSPMLVFLPDHLRNFRGERPTLIKPYQWRIIPSQKRNFWFDQAGFMNNDSIDFTLGISDAQKTLFERHTIAVPARQTILSEGSMPPVEVIADSQKKNVALKLVSQDAFDFDNEALAAKTEREKVFAVIHDRERIEDARYVRTALDAAIEFSKSRAVVKSENRKAKVESWQNADAVFWLSSAPPPDELLRVVQNESLLLISDASTREYSANENVVMTKGGTGSFSLWRRVPPIDRGASLWLDAFGKPLLGCEGLGAGLHYRYFSRFHPFWSDLVLTKEFPEFVFSLITRREESIGETPSIDKQSDQRRMSLQQIIPHAKKQIASARSSTRTTSLHLPFLFGAALLFILERWMSERKAT